MVSRIHTSKDAEAMIIELQNLLHFSTKARVIRLGLSLSLLEKEDPRTELISNSKGGDYQRFTITGENDELIKAMIIQHHGEKIVEEEYFPVLFTAHVERGIRLLHSEYINAGNYDKLVKNLLNKGL